MTRTVQFIYLLGALGVLFALFQLYLSPEMVYHLASLRLC
ncbi:hypothetical protein BOA8489_03074 [Boseongicola aestuarii]|jgi:hypothetical protein|uniref:Uncharacterized protein n=1 Tax=Boseongicola aestuarii TaxID=1470561 RepID=A0A238J3P1_9RHOB|nr:hypothetical protein BOA8489_03074 [Boseongicola aestuarii]